MLLKLSKILNIISFKLRQKSIYFELKHYIKNKDTSIYLKPVYNHERGIGKTYSLIELAHKYKCPIAVTNGITEKYIKQMSQKTFNKDIEIINASQQCRGKRRDVILIEEGIDRDIINEVLRPMCKTLVGFEQRYYK